MRHLSGVRHMRSHPSLIFSIVLAVLLWHCSLRRSIVCIGGDEDWQRAMDLTEHVMMVNGGTSSNGNTCSKARRLLLEHGSLDASLDAHFGCQYLCQSI